MCWDCLSLGSFPTRARRRPTSHQTSPDKWDLVVDICLAVSGVNVVVFWFSVWAWAGKALKLKHWYLLDVNMTRKGWWWSTFLLFRKVRYVVFCHGCEYGCKKVQLSKFNTFYPIYVISLPFFFSHWWMFDFCVWHYGIEQELALTALWAFDELPLRHSFAAITIEFNSMSFIFLLLFLSTWCAHAGIQADYGGAGDKAFIFFQWNFTAM